MSASSRFAVATHVLLALGSHPGERLSSSALAETVNTNPVVIRRLLGALARANLIVTTSGNTGGAELSRAPERISLRDVYVAVGGGDIFALNPSVPNRSCPLSCSMKDVLLPVFAAAEQALADRLGETTLADLVAEVAARADEGGPPDRAGRVGRVARAPH